MAKGRATQASKASQKPAPLMRRPSALTLSISLPRLLIAPLCWNFFSSGGNGLFTSANQQGKVYRLPQTDYDSNPAPIPGELLIRIEEPLGEIFQNELAKSLQTAAFSLGEVPLSALIGQRLSAEQFEKAWP